MKDRGKRQNDGAMRGRKRQGQPSRKQKQQDEKQEEKCDRLRVKSTEIVRV